MLSRRIETGRYTRPYAISPLGIPVEEPLMYSRRARLMSPLPSRTGQTHLTDDQLLLFDFLFDCHCVPFRALCRANYRVSMNVPYTHTLDDDDLAQTLKELHTRGLVTAQTLKELHAHGLHTAHPAEHLAYDLTARGGQLWEVERQPDWDAYCINSRTFGDGDVRDEVTVYAPVLATAEAFLRTAHACGLYICDQSQPNVIRHQAGVPSSPIPWKTFADAYEIQATLQPGHSSSDGVDWAWYERHRTWWRTIGELITLHDHTRLGGA